MSSFVGVTVGGKQVVCWGYSLYWYRVQDYKSFVKYRLIVTVSSIRILYRIGTDSLVGLVEGYAFKM